MGTTVEASFSDTVTRCKEKKRRNKSKSHYATDLEAQNKQEFAIMHSEVAQASTQTARAERVECEECKQVSRQPGAPPGAAPMVPPEIRWERLGWRRRSLAGSASGKR